MKLPRQIYMIRNSKTGRIYIGSSKNAELRYRNHISMLRTGTHPVEDMQQDYIQYPECFSFCVLGEIKKFDERKKEQAWMLLLNSYVRGCGYNYKEPVFNRKGNNTMQNFKHELQEIIENLNENEAIFMLMFAKRFFGIEKGESNGKQDI